MKQPELQAKQPETQAKQPKSEKQQKAYDEEPLDQATTTTVGGVTTSTTKQRTTRTLGSKYFGNTRRRVKELTRGFDAQCIVPQACHVLA